MLPEPTKIGLANVLRGVAELTGLTSFGHLGDKIDNSSAGVEKELSESWYDTVITHAERKTGMGYFNILLSPRTEDIILDSHRELFKQAGKKIDSGMSRHDAQKSIIDSISGPAGTDRPTGFEI